MVSNGLMFGKDTHITLYLSTDFRQFKVKHNGILLCQPLFHAQFFSKKLEIIDWIKFIEAFANFEVCTRLKLKWAVVKILAPDCLGGITLHIINHDCNAFFVTMHSLFQCILCLKKGRALKCKFVLNFVCWNCILHF